MSLTINYDPRKDIRSLVADTIVDHLNTKFKRSKFKPNGGFRRPYGYSMKVYGLLDIITVDCRVYEDMATGRMMINTNNFGSDRYKKQFQKIIKLVSQYNLDGLAFEHELSAAPTHWFKFTIQ